jgi:hypothetical protein
LTSAPAIEVTHTHTSYAGAGHPRADAQRSHARPGHTTDDSQTSHARAGHGGHVAQSSSARPGQSAVDTQRCVSGAGTLAEIRAWAELLDDLEQVRIANGNRIAAIRDTRGGVAPDMDVVEASVQTVEHEVELALCRAWRRHPLAPWAKAIPGCGEKLIGRLIAIIGDPSLRAIGHMEELPSGRRMFVVDGYEERAVSQLWAYCGHGDALRGRKVKGATQAELFRAGNPDAKKATWKLAYQFMRTVGNDRAPRSPYRDAYEDRKAETEGRKHERACPRCGPAGRPAPAGSPWSDAHRHADALRIVGKTFLRDLWREARRLRGLDYH